MVLSYIVGQMKNPIPYPMKSITVYVLMTVAFYVIMHFTSEWHLALRLVINTLLIVLFLAHVYWHEIRKK